MSDEPRMDRPWRLALIVDDIHAIKVAAAYYTLPKRDRGDLARLAEVSGVDQGIASILTRLASAGMLQEGEPPAVLVQLIGAFVAKQLAKGR